jgi:LDH2 family malate/lactate/ureidoglycolate dehydrogenase
VSSRLGPHHRLAASRLREFARRVLEAVGVPEEDATLLADLLVEADCRGVHSHGVTRLPVYVARLQGGAMAAKTVLSVVSESPGTLLLDGGNGPGHVACVRSMELAVAKAREAGVAVVALRNSNHNGTQAAYAMRALRADMIGLCATLGGNVMAPWGGISPLLGNNPFGLAAPTAEEPPFVLDMACSVAARGWIMLAEKRGEPIPEGWAIDAEGNPTRDPSAALAGTVLPIGGHKGYGLSMLVAVLTGVLTGAAVGASGFLGRDLKDVTDRRQDSGHLLATLDISRFMPVPEFKARMDRFIRDMRDSQRAPGVERIYVPGELEDAAQQEAERLGVPVEEAVLRELEALARRLGIAW